MPDEHDAPELAVQVTDVRALRSLSHPLGSRLLGQLRLHGPATASRLGRAVGGAAGPPATTCVSCRLRLVEEVEGQGTARERWWRARHRMTSWRAGELLAQEGGAQVEEEMTRLQIDQQARVLDAWHEQKDQLGQAWTDAAPLNDYGLRLTPGRARELAGELNATLVRWMADHPGDAPPVEGSEQVCVLLDLVPLREWPS